jgi:hypothetical protein
MKRHHRWRFLIVTAILVIIILYVGWSLVFDRYTDHNTSQYWATIDARMLLSLCKQ